MSTHYDLIIVGTGSGNSIPGPAFEDKSIAIVEKGVFGGTCLNVGCIPTKMFVYASEVARTVSEAEKYGIHATFDGVDWPSIVSRVFEKRIDPIAAGGEAYRRGPETPNITVYDQHASFVGPKTLRTGQGDKEAVITGDTIVIATGARPFIPEIVTESGVEYLTNENVMRLEELPRSLVVWGGGFIAMEFAHMFSALGVDVKVINRSPQLLRVQDTDIAERFTELTTQAMECHLGHNVTAITGDSSQVTVTLNNGEEVSGEKLLVALGRTPNGDQMNLEAAGIEMRDDGRIKVDDYGRTTAEGVWAIGDVSSPYQLKHVANAETRALVHNLTHPDEMKKMPHDFVPSGIFTYPQIATVGLTEKQVREAGYPLTIKIQNFGDVAYGWAMEDSTGFVKLIADRSTGKLLGAHIIGPQATTLLQQLITVMAFDLDLRAVASDEYWIHPALPEVIENALLGLEFD